MGQLSLTLLHHVLLLRAQFQHLVIGDGMGLSLFFKTWIEFRFCNNPPYSEYKITSLPFTSYKIPKNSTYKYLFPISSLGFLPLNAEISSAYYTQMFFFLD